MKTLKKGGDISYLFHPYTSEKAIATLVDVYEENKYLDKDELVEIVKANLPDGFLQYRVRAFSYQSLRRLYKQRQKHRLSWWHDFLNELIPQLEHQTLIRETWEI